MKRGGRAPGVRAGGAGAQPPAARCASLLERQRVANESVGTLDAVAVARRRHRRQRPGLPGPRRRALRPPVVLPRQRGRGGAGRGGRGVHPPVLRRGDRRPAADHRPAGARGRELVAERWPSGAGRGSRCAPPSAATSAGSSSWPSATRGSRSTRRSSRPSAAASSASRRSTALQEALGLDALPLRIECFDISNLMGTHTVASMVVFEGGAPKKSDYRRFTIRGLTEGVPDDFAAMEEVLARRLAQWERQQDLSPARPQAQRVASRRCRTSSSSTAARASCRRACARCRASCDRGVAVVSLAKRIEEVFLPGRPRADRPAATTRRSCSCCSACATRRTASRSPTTAPAATRR